MTVALCASPRRNGGPATQRDALVSTAQLTASAFARVMLALLFLFLPREVDHPKYIPADLPTTHHAACKPDALRDDALILTITRDGSRYLRNTKMWPGTLPDSLREALYDRAPATVCINAGSRAKYANLKAVVDRIRHSGDTNITFLVNSGRP